MLLQNEQNKLSNRNWFDSYTFITALNICMKLTWLMVNLKMLLPTDFNADLLLMQILEKRLKMFVIA